MDGLALNLMNLDQVWQLKLIGQGVIGVFCLIVCTYVCSYLATWDYPVGNSQEGQTYGDPQHCPALHPDGLLPQTGQVLVPDSQQLLLAVGMGNELEREKKFKSMENKARGDGSTGQGRWERRKKQPINMDIFREAIIICFSHPVFTKHSQFYSDYFTDPLKGL